MWRLSARGSSFWKARRACPIHSSAGLSPSRFRFVLVLVFVLVLALAKEPSEQSFGLLQRRDARQQLRVGLAQLADLLLQPSKARLHLALACGLLLTDFPAQPFGQLLHRLEPCLH